MCVYTFVVITFLLLYEPLNPYSSTFAFSYFMASTSIILPVSEMAELRSHGIRVPILFPIDAHGVDVVSSIQFSIRFFLKSYNMGRMWAIPSWYWIASSNLTWDLQANRKWPCSVGARSGKVKGLWLSRFSDVNVNRNPCSSLIVHDCL